MISIDKITEIFFVVDEFCKEFDHVIKEHFVTWWENQEKKLLLYIMRQRSNDYYAALPLRQRQKPEALLYSLCSKTYAKRLPSNRFLQQIC